ncbi:MAG: hypothetical protein WCF57_09390 [Pyrinomonadaceae bacterium]
MSRSENSLSVRTKIKAIEVYDEADKIDDDDDRAGHIDVGYWLERGGDAFDDVLGVADVRIYFKRTDISLDELKASAIAYGHHILSQIAENYKPAPSDVNTERMWKQ